MAGISEIKAMAAKRRGMGLARHLGLKPGTDRYNAVKFGTARAAGWHPSREKGITLREAHRIAGKK